MSFYLNGGPSPNNQYWQGSFSSANFGTNEVIQYYLYLTFDGVNGVANTYVYGGDGFSNTTASQVTAAASPFTVRKRPAWLFHAGNRVVTPNANGTNSTVGFWIKIGYQSKDSSIRWADNACVYYTTDGSTPAGSRGIGSGTTQVMPMSYDHEEDDTSIAGNAMWWVGTVTNMPNNTAINYKIGVWNSSNGEEKFADYDAGTPNTVFNFSIGAANGTNVVTLAWSSATDLVGRERLSHFDRHHTRWRGPFQRYHQRNVVDSDEQFWRASLRNGYGGQQRRN